MKPTAVVNTRMVARHGNSSSSDEGWAIFQENDILNIRCNSGGSTDPYKASVAFPGITAGEWYHVVMVLDRDGNKIKGYLNGSTNGVYLPSASWSDTFTSDSMESGGQNIVLGTRGDAYEWAGWLDDFAIWKRALSADEIAEIYEKGLHGLTFTEEIIRGTLILVK